jgi:hypothetical protein
LLCVPQAFVRIITIGRSLAPHGHPFRAYCLSRVCNGLRPSSVIFITCERGRPAHPLPLFPLALSGHAGAISLDISDSPRMFNVFPSRDAANANCLFARGADVSLGEARRSRGCKGKPKCNQVFHNHVTAGSRTTAKRMDAASRSPVAEADHPDRPLERPRWAVSSLPLRCIGMLRSHLGHQRHFAGNRCQALLTTGGLANRGASSSLSPLARCGVSMGRLSD